MLVANLSVLFIITQLPPVSAQSIDQREEPAVVMGGDIPDFDGMPVGDIWVYAYIGSSWEQIPFQVDEKNNATDSYFVDAIDGILDSNDEIVFMPFDAGEVAPTTEWVPDTGLQRYEVTVTDPIDASMKYAYIYASSSLTQIFTKDYVAYNSTYHVITAIDYTIGFDDAKIGIMDEIRINTSAGGDNTDIFDRLKYRGQIFSIPFDEDDFNYNLGGYKDGPVRLIHQIDDGSDDFVNINYAYKSYAIATQEIYLGASPDWVRLSMDFLSTSTPMTYYDSNGNDLTINGIPDSPTSTGVPTWAEVTGSHGTIVMPRDYSAVGGSSTLYYNDDLSSNDAPESEIGEYGDSGIYITNPPIGNPTSFVTFYFLPANQGNVGSTYDAFTNNPLIINTMAQYMDSSPLPEITDVSALPDPQDVEGYVNISANIVDNYELYGAWVDITDPNDNPAGNFSLSFDSITSRYYDNRTYNIVGTYGFTIWTNDTSNNWNSSFGQFMIQDTVLPTITDATALSDPQEIYGHVNISAVIEDDYDLHLAWVDITDPNSVQVGNFSMNYDSSNGRYYDNRTYGIVGAYQFTIWVNDTSGNWNFTTGQFIILDTTKPILVDVAALPNPQEVYEHMNISAAIEDNYELHGAWIDIRDPNGDPIGNFSMSYDSDNNRFYLEQAYDIVGIYQFTIWTNDTSSNWNYTSGQFEMLDTTLPTITDSTALPAPQDVNDNVDISAVMDDNYELHDAWINITDPNGDTVGNFSMSYDSGSNRYHDEQTYDIVGIYQYVIWVNDTSNNWNYSSGQFEMVDTIFPTITTVTELPDPQEIYGNVNISAVIADDYELLGAWIEITDPDGEPLANHSMGHDLTTGRYFDDRAYDKVGRYNFIIWATDSSGNWEYRSGQFMIQDMTSPIAHAGPDQTVTEGAIVTFDGSASTDNVGVVEYSWTFFHGTLQTLQGISPTYTFTDIGDYEVTLSAIDAEDNQDTDTMWVNVTAVPDNTPPTILHTPETAGKPGESVTISAEITDDIGVEEVFILYRQRGDAEWIQVKMTETSEDIWTADIPSSEITTAGIEYYITATDGTNNSTHPASLEPYQITIRGEEKETDSSGWILLIIFIIIIIAVVIVFFLILKSKKGKKGEIEWK